LIIGESGGLGGGTTVVDASRYPMRVTLLAFCNDATNIATTLIMANIYYYYYEKRLSVF
jgi:hypothetical protein